MAKRLKIGDVVQVDLPLGRLFAHKVADRSGSFYGDLFLVPPHLYGPDDPASAAADGGVPIFAPLEQVIGCQYPEILFSGVGSKAVPRDWQELPTFAEQQIAFRDDRIDVSTLEFRWGLIDPKTGRQWPAGPGDDLERYPRRRAGTSFVLVYLALLAAGWPTSHANLAPWFGIEPADLAAAPITEHFLHFQTPKAVRLAARRLELRGETRVVEVEDAWQVILADHAPEIDLDLLDGLERVAAELGGVYHGWERPI